MNKLNSYSKSALKVAGTLEIVLSSFWCYHNAELFYEYRANPKVLRPFIIPDWALDLNFLIGLIGIWCGIQVIKSNWTIQKGYLILIGLWLTAQLPLFF